MIDKLGRNITYMRLSITDRCNLRCRYCMPAEGVCKKSHTDMLTEDEIIHAVEVAAVFLNGFGANFLAGLENTVATQCHAIYVNFCRNITVCIQGSL